MYNRSSWSFNEQIAKTFNEHVRKSISFYDRMQEMVASFSDYFISDNDVIYDLGCSLGETIKQIQKRHPYKQVKYIGIDSSPSMIRKAKSLNKSPLVTFNTSKLEEYEFPQKSNFIIALLILQFLPIPKRKAVIQRVYENLHDGGCFILVEKIYSSNSKMQDIFTHLLYDSKYKNGLSEKEILLKEQSLRGVLTPITMSEYISLLSNIGFHVDIFLKEWNFIGFAGIKGVNK